MRGGPTWLNKSENAKTNLLWSPGTTADINFFRFPTRVARGIFGTRGPPPSHLSESVLSAWQYVYPVAAHMKSINYADSVTQTYPLPSLFPMWRLFRSFPCSLPSSLPSGIVSLAWPPSRVRIISRIPVPLLRSLALPPPPPPPSPTSAMLARDANNVHFGILHGRCNERSYRGYNAVTSARCNCDSGRPDLRLPFYCRHLLY